MSTRQLCIGYDLRFIFMCKFICNELRQERPWPILEIGVLHL